MQHSQLVHTPLHRSYAQCTVHTHTVTHTHTHTHTHTRTQADQRELAAYEAQSASARNQGLFFKQLYKADAQKDEEEGGSGTLGKQVWVSDFLLVYASVS